MTIYNNLAIYKNNDLLGSYLAGLWEGDGHIKINKCRNCRPSFHITFNILDNVLAQRLLDALTVYKIVGTLTYKRKENVCVLNIYSIDGLKGIVNLINGKLRLPKAYQIDLIIDWLNQKHNTDIKKLPITRLAISNDAWLAGFIDADGYFGVTVKAIKGKSYFGCQFQLSQRILDPKTGKSYAPVIKSIAEYFHVKVRIKKDKLRRYYVIEASSTKSKKMIRAYLDKFSLLSSKYLDYKDWCVVDDLIMTKQHLIQEERVRQIKNTMNTSRTELNWDHLNLL